MLLYNITYRNAKTGQRLAETDMATPLPKKAPKGLIAYCDCRNGAKDESCSVDEHGNIRKVK